MTTASARDLSPGALASDPQFASIYEEHYDYVWTNLRRLGVQGADLDDAVQETFLIVHRRWGAFDPEGSWRGWLFGIARRIASRHRRGFGRHLRLLAATVPREAPPIDDIEDELTRRQAVRLVQSFLDRLHARKREVFILADIEGFTGAEIAELLDVSPNTVGSRLRSARGEFERYVETLRARERGVAVRLDRRALIGRCRDARPPARSRERVRKALAARLAMPGGAMPWWGAVKPFALATGLGAVAVTAAAATWLPQDSAPDPHAPVQRDAEPERAQPSTRRAVAPADPVLPSPMPEPAPPARDVPAMADGTAAAPPPGTPDRARRRPDATPPTNASTFAAETALVARIRGAAQDGDPERVLQLADEHASRFPDGVLQRERRALAIAALCRLGQHSAAAREAGAHAGAQPDAPLPAEVRHGCPEAEKK